VRLKEQYPHQIFFDPNNGYYACGLGFLYKDSFKPYFIEASPPTTQGRRIASHMLFSHWRQLL
jgi:hypothetical protein